MKEYDNLESYLNELDDKEKIETLKYIISIQKRQIIGFYIFSVFTIIVFLIMLLENAKK